MSVGQIHLYVRDRDFTSLGRGSHALKAVLERLSWFADEDGLSVFPKMQSIADAAEFMRAAMEAAERKRGFRFESPMLAAALPTPLAHAASGP